jgi:hypothetical protein
MIIAVVLVLIAFIVVGVMLSRQTTKSKKRAIADLDAEKENVEAFDIFALVESEVSALGLDGIEGAEGIPHGVLLKVWSDSQGIADSCADQAHLRYVVAEGVDPADATDADVNLECTKPNPKDDTHKTPDDE